MRLQAERRVNYRAEVGIAEKRTAMDIAELENAESFEIGRKLRNRDIDLADPEITPLDECAVAERGCRRDHGSLAGKLDHAPAVCVCLGRPALQHEARRDLEDDCRRGEHEVKEGAGPEKRADPWRDVKLREDRRKRQRVAAEYDPGKSDDTEARGNELAAAKPARSGAEEDHGDPRLHQEKYANDQ